MTIQEMFGDVTVTPLKLTDLDDASMVVLRLDHEPKSEQAEWIKETWRLITEGGPFEKVKLLVVGPSVQGIEALRVRPQAKELNPWGVESIQQRVRELPWSPFGEGSPDHPWNGEHVVRLADVTAMLHKLQAETEREARTNG